MIRFILFIFGVFLLGSCSNGDSMGSGETSVDVAIIPHHMLTRATVDIFYKSLREKYPNPDRVVIISPNHFNYGSSVLESVQKSGKICFRGNCIDAIPYPGYQFLESSFPLFVRGETTEHGIGEHFAFINRYFPGIPVMPIVVRRSLVPGDGEVVIAKQIASFTGRTLVLTSVDFSHHVDEKIARFHDLLAQDVLSNGDIADFSKLEVDCRNCLLIAQQIARITGKPYFSFFARTSVDSVLGTRSDIENTSHIFGTFESTGSHAMTGVFAFVGDTQIARGINEYDIKKPKFLSNILKDFYEKKDTTFPLETKYNRIGTGFDFFIANLEATFDTESCENKGQGIMLRMQPESIKKLTAIGINMFNLANNHTDDCGHENQIAMHNWFLGKGIAAFGDLHNQDQSYAWTGVIRGEKYAIIGINAIETTTNWDKKIQNIKNYTSSGYLVLLNIHWGKEYSSGVSDIQRKIAHDSIDAGARLIIGHHTHVVGESEIYKNIPIYYSLGNFLFDQDFPETLPGIMVACEISRRSTHCDNISFHREKNTFAIRFD